MASYDTFDHHVGAAAGSEDDYESEEEQAVPKSKAAKGKGKAKQQGAGGEKEVKRRSSKACDNCRKSKCKCTRVLDPKTNEPVGPCDNCTATGAECTSLGASRKRGPPKGYIEAIEQRLHRMEALLGGLLNHGDPRAAVLLGELIGNDDARDILANDLQPRRDPKARQTWKLSDEAPASPAGHVLNSSSSEFNQESATLKNQKPPVSSTGLWFTSDDNPAPRNDNLSRSFDDTSSLGYAQYRNPAGETPSTFGGLDIPIAPRSIDPRSQSLPRPPSVSKDVSSSSPRNRRRLTLQSADTTPNALLSPGTAGISVFQGQSKAGLAPNAINHTGQSSYVLGADAELSAADVDGGAMTELADVVGQLSLNENAEVRYHGRSSGLYLISKSTRYKNFFWQFPAAGTSSVPELPVVKTETEVLRLLDCENPLPDNKTQQHLLDLYWTYVHPHFPILYKVSFFRQYRHGMANPDSKEPSTPSGGGKVPVVLLLAMFALASRYSNLEDSTPDGTSIRAGKVYLEKAKKILNYDYESSKLVSVQAMLLIAYQEIGMGGMSSAWIRTGMATRMAQDLGLFRDVEKWFLPVQKFTHEEKQTRKRVWWGCIILDRYTASYIGRPGNIHERDYDTSFPSETEPDEQEQWKPIRPDGREFSSVGADPDATDPLAGLSRYPTTKAHSLSCFNAAGALAVIINRIIANIYAIRTRVLGQSSTTLLSLLDQSLASWYLALPPHLAYNPASAKVPPPHILSLHLQFYSALILLHRPFIPGQNSVKAPGNFPSHSICTTSAYAIAKIATVFSSTFSLRQCPPFLVYPIFSAAVVCVYNAGFEEGLAYPAKVNLARCMSALKEMEVIWGSAARQYELLNGLVDLRDAELGADLHSFTNDDQRGTKRPAGSDTSPLESTSLFSTSSNFDSRLLGKAGSASSMGPIRKPRRRSSSGSARVKTENRASNLAGSPIIAEELSFPNIHLDGALGGGMFSHFAPSPVSHEGAHQSYELLGDVGPVLDLSQFRSPPGTSGGVTNFTDLLNSFLSPTEDASNSINRVADHMQLDQTHNLDTSAFYGFPIGVETDEWASYLPPDFFPEQDVAADVTEEGRGGGV